MTEETRNAYGAKLKELIQKDPNIVVLDADLTKSTKTIEAKQAVPERHSSTVCLTETHSWIFPGNGTGTAATERKGGTLS